jgi:F-type H+-transporting ATPase subunit a
MHLHTGTHVVVQLLGMQVNLDTLWTTWLSAIIVFVLVFAASRGRKLVPTGIQNFTEWIVEALLAQFEKNVGPKYRQVVPALLTLFLFIFVANQIGLLPTAHLTASPTNDINTTLGLALGVTVFIHALYIINKGVGNWIKHFFEPFVPFVFINLVEEVSRPITLAMRLFGNILAGEILLEVLYNLAPWLVPIVWIAFSLFVGLIQAYIFTTLSSVYLKHSL